MLITGGRGAMQSAEIYHPDRDSACVLADLPDRPNPRWFTAVWRLGDREIGILGDW